MTAAQRSLPRMFPCTGYAANSAEAELASFSFERRDVDDVEIEILFCGVCHSDGEKTVYPCVPGHEIVGRVTRVGAAVTAFKPGELAGVGGMVDSCRVRGLQGGCRELL